MFSRPTKPHAPSLPALSEPRKQAPKIAGLIAAETTIDGLVRSDGDLHVDGAVHGDVKAHGVTIGETGHIEGVITAHTVEVRGRVIGTIIAGSVRLYGTAYVDGDIRHDQLSIEPGAFFQGRCLRRERDAAAKSAAGSGEVIELQASA